MHLLQRIKSDDFVFSLGYELPPKAMRKILLRTQECAELRKAYWSGSLTESVLRQYIQNLMSNMRVGERFPFDIVLALIAVGLEQFNTEFAEEYLSDLASLELAELPVSIGVAKVCLVKRDERAANIYRTFSSSPVIETDIYQEISRIPEKVKSDYFTFEAA
jgi:hypothetical protein